MILRNRLTAGLCPGAPFAGDDVLIGILAGLSIVEGGDSGSEEVFSNLRTGIKDAARGRTPVPSGQRLLAAYERSFGEQIIGLWPQGLPVEPSQKTASRVS